MDARRCATAWCMACFTRRNPQGTVIGSASTSLLHKDKVALTHITYPKAFNWTSRTRSPPSTDGT